MNTFKTIEEAREHAKNDGEVTHIIEIEPGVEGINPYMCARAGADAYRKLIDLSPIPEIKRVIGEVVDFESERIAEKEARIKANVPGFDELRNNINDWESYYESCSRRAKSEKIDGVNPPERPEVKVREIAKKYPVAAAYMKADEWSLSSHGIKSGAGDEAKSRIENGEDYEKVIAEMEKEWIGFADGNGGL